VARDRTGCYQPANPYPGKVRRDLRKPLACLQDNHLAMTPFEPVVIPTETLILRFLSEADLPTVYDIFSHPEVMRYWSYPP